MGKDMLRLASVRELDMLWMFSIDPVLGEDRRPIIPTDESLNLGLVV